jgi:flagellar FliL protein
MKKLLVSVIALLAILGLIGGLYAAGIIPSGTGAEGTVLDEHGNPVSADAASSAQPLYLAMDPPFVVNFEHRGTLHYLQLEMQMMYHDQSIIDTIVANMPAVRNELILLLSNQDFETLITSDGKEKLREGIVKAVNSVAGVEPDETSGESDGEVYLTHFVMQ